MEVIEEHELTSQLVVIRRDGIAQDGQLRLSLAALEIAEHLIVGAVLFDHIDHVLDW